MELFFKVQTDYFNKKNLTKIFNTFKYNHKIGLENKKEAYLENNIEDIIDKILKNESFLKS